MEKDWLSKSGEERNPDALFKKKKNWKNGGNRSEDDAKAKERKKRFEK